MGLNYRGTINRLKSGQTCQTWTSDTPNLSGYPVSRYTKAFIPGVGVSLKLSGAQSEKNQKKNQNSSQYKTHYHSYLVSSSSNRSMDIRSPLLNESALLMFKKYLARSRASRSVVIRPRLRSVNYFCGGTI